MIGLAVGGFKYPCPLASFLEEFFFEVRLPKTLWKNADTVANGDVYTDSGKLCHVFCNASNRCFQLPNKMCVKRYQSINTQLFVFQSLRNGINIYDEKYLFSM